VPNSFKTSKLKRIRGFHLNVGYGLPINYYSQALKKLFCLGYMASNNSASVSPNSGFLKLDFIYFRKVPKTLEYKAKNFEVLSTEWGRKKYSVHKTLRAGKRT
jgi:hypothetical protein